VTGVKIRNLTMAMHLVLTVFSLQNVKELVININVPSNGKPLEYFPVSMTMNMQFTK
jgi:hypothetical protein